MEKLNNDNVDVKRNDAQQLENARAMIAAAKEAKEAANTSPSAPPPAPPVAG